MRAGFVGLGSQGAPMARRIVDAGVPTTLWARRPATLEPFAGTAAVTAASAAEVGAASDLACVCVVDDAGVREVVAGPDGLLAGMRPGTVIAVHSTVHPDTCGDLAGQAAGRGVALLDAPVSGGGPAAAEGRLLVMVGGDAETAERARPVLETFGDPVVHLGPVGAGQRAKLLNNLLFTAHLGVAESAYALARRMDVDPERLATVLAKGSGNSFGASVVGRPDFTLRAMGELAGALLHKDVGLVADLAEPAAGAGAEPSAVLAAADAALRSMGRPR
ncbi:NAD(P)-dependent oxidoreductase [Actinomadura sp. WMMB 499]|nr:NAD(P)-dependent oxidoreductase [Actinomadura sp. WMMB 499]